MRQEDLASSSRQSAMEEEERRARERREREERERRERERAELQAQVDRESAEYDQLVDERAVIQDHIEQLQTAERQMRVEKNEVHSLRRNIATRGHNLMSRQWRGQIRNEHDDSIQQEFRRNYDNYFTQTDNLHDAIILRIAELQNEARERTNIIGRIQNSLNTLRARIRTLLN